MNQRVTLKLLIVALALASANAAAAREGGRVSVAVLEMGSTPTAARAGERLTARLSSVREGGARLALLDRGMSAAAARGVGYAGSLNMTLAEARALGAALGCDFFLTGDAQTIRRSSSARPVYFEAYASVFVVSARTGRLVHWDRPAAEAGDAAGAEAALLASLEARAAPYAAAIGAAAADDERERFETAATAPSSVIDLSADAGADVDLREPAPYRRLRPAYTDAASRAEAEATVDAEAEIGEDGSVRLVRVVRWAGFGLDEEVVSTVRRMRFRPAERDGEPVAVRVLLRYNFRKPPKNS
jgi:TonB family protein